MLLGNYSVFNRNADTLVGTAFTNPQARFKPTAFLRYYQPDTLQDGRSLAAWFTGYGVGEFGGSAWWLPLVAGEMSAVNQSRGVASATFAGAMGVNAGLTAAGAGAASFSGQLVSSGSVSAAGSSTASFAAVATLNGELTATGAGSATFTGEGLGSMALTAAGAGGVSATLTALGYMELTVEVGVSETLSVSNVAAAVWGAESGDGMYTYAEVLRIVAAVTAGKASGGPGSPVFRDLADTKDVVSGTADSNGNRTAVTYNP